MKIPFSIEPTSRNIRLDNVQLHANQPKAQIEREIGHLVTGSRVHMNGYGLYLGGLTFHGHPSKLYLRFHNERLCEALWHVELPDAPQDRGWPTREAINDEVAFVREALGRYIGFDLSRRLLQKFSWGEVWSTFDEKGFQARNGVRYTAQ